MSVVIDAGAVVELLVSRGFEGPVRDALKRDGGVARAPELLDVEVLSVVRGLLLRDEITSRVAAFAVAELRRSPIVRTTHRALVGRAWELRDRLTSYDAVYVALAERGDSLGGPATLVTTDARLARTVHSIGTVPVVVVPVP